ncbi:DNA gyrase subunit A [Candidatus Woesearchaeota archaeon]|nr:DNA gyrase subunit A [Candidatus Woesearchaeota archaeon]
MEEKDKKTEEKTAEKIIPRLIEDEMKQSYIDYAMSVIVGRALPDARDGLKPVHRRILYGMYDMGMLHNRPFKKSARVVGEILGKYHPHGDTAVYDSLVRMAQDFSLRYTLVNGQGNFGSVDGDSAAAMRYTECKLKKIAEEMLQDIDKETVKFVPNFDESLTEPSILPSKIPNLIINGSSGIAVGMATNIPPHNLSEVCSAIAMLIDNPDISLGEIMDVLKGPDFPTGGIIAGIKGVELAYKTGSGRARIKSRTTIEKHKDRERIIVTEIPYMVNKAQLIEQIADLVRDKSIEGISDIRDESDREGMRIVIELKRDASTEIVINNLMLQTRMQVTFGINMLALVNNEPKLLGIREMMQNYVDHRRDIVRKRTAFDLKKAEEKIHILEGLIVAISNIDDTIRLIRESSSGEEAKEVLVSNFSLSEIQAQAILDMKLQRLTNMEQGKIKEEHLQLISLSKGLREILASEQRILGIIKEELAEIRNQYGDERRTEINYDEEDDIDIEDLVAEENQVITVSHLGYVKRQGLDEYRRQARGGIGIKAATVQDDDFVEHIFIANTHSYVLLFTDKGKVYWLKAYQIPEASRTGKGKAIVNLIKLEPGEKINAYIHIRDFEHGKYLVLATKKGIIKKTPLEEYSNPRKGGIKAINLDSDDRLINAKLTDGDREILLATRKGLAIRFNEQDARPIGRTSHGVIGMRLRRDDEVVGMVIVDDTKTLFTITENGYGKRTSMPEYRTIGRGGIGVINIQCTERNGNVVSARAVSDEDELMIISKSGIVIRILTASISVIGRNTQGVRIMKLRENDKVVSAEIIVPEEDAPEQEQMNDTDDAIKKVEEQNASEPNNYP